MTLNHTVCDYCQQTMKRYQLTQHDNICSEKPVMCTLKGLLCVYINLCNVLFLYVYRKGNKERIDANTSKS